MIVKAPTAILLALSAITTAFAWGTVPHEVIGHVAQGLLSDKGHAFIRRTLRPRETLSSVSAWADTVKMEKKYEHTDRMHFVQTKQQPAELYDYDDDRDCHDGQCIVGAIAQFTKIAVGTSGAPYEERYEAIKFLVHFLGDITQPLHVCGRCNGGNTAKIKYKVKRRKYSLHKIWDTIMPEQRIRENFGRSPEIYADFLVDKITYGKYRTLAPLWLSKHGLTDVNKKGNSLAAIDWVTDSVALNCDVVWPDYDADPAQDFSTKYYKKVAPAIDCQLAKAGYRLADWINKIAETNLDFDMTYGG